MSKNKKNEIPQYIRNLKQKNTKITIDFTIIITKKQYNIQYNPITINIKNKVYIYLYYNYYLFEKPNKKLSEQCIGFFNIIHYIKRLVYKINLSF